MSLLALELGNKLIPHHRSRCLVGHLSQLSCQLVKRDLGIHHDGLHRSQLLQRIVDLHRIKNAKGFLANGVTQPSCPSQHLVKQNPAVNASQKDQIANLRHVYPGGQQVYRDGDIWVALVFIASDQLQWVVSFSCYGFFEQSLKRYIPE